MTANNELHVLSFPPEDDKATMRVLSKRLSLFLKRPLMYVEEKDVASVVEGLEYSMQLVLGLPLDRNYHKYWWRVSGCRCPSLDNQDRWGTPYRVISADCPYHGDKNEDQ